MRDHARQIYRAALQAVDPYNAVKNAVKRSGSILTVGGQDLDLAAYQRILVIGAGKASAPMALAMEELLGPVAGVVLVKDGHLAPVNYIKLLEASHPLPDKRSVQGARAIMELVQSAGADTLIFNLLSGGGSALMVAPAKGISLADKQRMTELLLAAGADINQINMVRKHLSLLKGGRLAQLAAPARLVSLIISDVVGDRLDSIASGPTVADASTWRDVGDIFTEFNLWAQAPAAICRLLQAGLAGEAPDTPKDIPDTSSNLIVASNRQALMAAKEKALALGYNSLLLSSGIAGDTSEAAGFHAAIAREVRQNRQPVAAPACIISGGETTVALPQHHGLGGRNQEFVLTALRHIRDLPGVLVLSLGTDGNDGPTDAAGGQVDSASWQKARELGLDYYDCLARHDAYNFLKATGDLIITGPTNTNVMDLHLLMIADGS